MTIGDNNTEGRKGALATGKMPGIGVSSIVVLVPFGLFLAGPDSVGLSIIVGALMALGVALFVFAVRALIKEKRYVRVSFEVSCVIGGLFFFWYCFWVFSAFASVHSNHGRTMNRIRKVEASLEGYRADNSEYPLGIICNIATHRYRRICNLTTPIAYLEEHQVIQDPFSYEGAELAYWSNKKNYLLWSCGPDEDYDITPTEVGGFYRGMTPETESYLRTISYDPTNGVRSSGDIFHLR